MYKRQKYVTEKESRVWRSECAEIRKNGGAYDKLVESGLTVIQYLTTSAWTSKIDKNKILKLHHEGLSRNAISSTLGYARATVSKVLKSNQAS